MTDSVDGIFSFPARVQTLSDDEVKSLLGLARAKAIDPQVFDEHAPFFFEANISSNRLDAYYTRMHRSSLENYRKDAEDGVSFQNSHNVRELGFGRSVNGRLSTIGPGDDGIDLIELDAAFYTLRGLNLNGVETDQFITGIRAGLIRDVSIGFYSPEYVCSICGRDLWDWDCIHIPGFKYTEGVDSEGNPTEEQTLAFAWVHNARLAEVSAVYDGATPGAAIYKAQQEAEAGRITPRQITLLEQRYRMRFADRKVISPGVDLPQGTTFSKETNMAGKVTRDQNLEEPQADAASATPEGEATENETPEAQAEDTTPAQELAGQLEAVRKLLDAAGAMAGSPDSPVRQRVADLVAYVRGLGDLRAQVKEQERKIAELTPLADQGRAYRADLVNDALAEGVRAYGSGFDEETYRTILESASLDAVKRMRDDWATVASDRLPGKRMSRDTQDQQNGEQNGVAPEIPPAAYRA